MSVNTSLIDADAQTVLRVRTCACVCGAKDQLQMQVDDVQVPIQELDLVPLADLSDMQIDRALKHRVKPAP